MLVMTVQAASSVRKIDDTVGTPMLLVVLFLCNSYVLFWFYV